MQRIEINNFGPIKNLNLEVKDFSVFIGPQASGKSTIAKSIFFFKSIENDLIDFFLHAFERNDFSKASGSFARTVRLKYQEYFGSSLHLRDVRLKYHYTEHIWLSITLEKNHGYVTPTFSDFFLEFINKTAKESGQFRHMISRRSPSVPTSNDLLQIESEKREFRLYIKTKCIDFFQDDRELIFIPAGRSLLAVLADQIQNIESRKLDLLMKVFVERINLLKPMFYKPLNVLVQERRFLTPHKIDPDKTKLAEKIIEKILRGKYQYDSEGEKIFYSPGKFVRLTLSSSGQQESLWILLLLFIIILEQQKVFIVIEEPEAHLFPEAQKEIVSLITLAANMKMSQVMITTHSPYILASINNLMLAHHAGKKHPEEVDKVIDKHLWLDRKTVFAGLVQSGEVVDIVDDELNLIRQECVDTVSSAINKEFEFLYRFES